MAVLAEHRRNGLVKEGKIEVRDVHEFKFGVLAFSRNVVSPLTDGFAISAGPRASDDDSDSKYSLLQFDWFNRAAPVPSLGKSIRVRRPGSVEVRFRWPLQR